MESLFLGFSSSPPFQNLVKTHKPFSNSVSFFLSSCSTCNSLNSHKTQILLQKKNSDSPNQTQQSSIPKSNAIQTTTECSYPSKSKYPHHSPSFHLWFESQLSLFFTGIFFPLSSLAASDSAFPAEAISNKINLEEVVVAVDQFFIRYPFFVYSVGVVWLIVIPLTEEYFQKYKFTSAINGYKKLKEDPTAQLLDIRDKKTLQVLGTPNLRILNKTAVQVEYREGDDEEVFVKEVLDNFSDPANTVICILDNFDGNSMKVAELLFKNGFKEAYAIKDGVRGKNGWQAIQESLLPPSVHIYPRKKGKGSQQPELNGGEVEQSANPSTPPTLSSGESEKYQDLKQPSSTKT